MIKPVRNYGRNYGSTDEQQVLGAVRNYPTYSVDKIAELLPEVKRNKIQQILEKNKLSRLEQRLEFSKPKSLKATPSQTPSAKIENPFKNLDRAALFVSFSRLFRGLIARFSLKKALIAGAFIPLLLIFNLVKTLISTEAPVIYLNQPGNNAVIHGVSVFVSGRVEPAQAGVTVNGDKAALNGDGTFTVVSDLSVGENVLEIEANYKFKRAKMLAIVTRELSEGEKEARTQQEEQMEKVSEIEKETTDILAVQDANQANTPVRITNNSLVKEGNYAKVIGEVFNFGDSDVSNVYVTVTFIGEKSEVLDTKSGVAVDFDQVLEPAARASFETVPTSVDFYRYLLSVEWDEG